MARVVVISNNKQSQRKVDQANRGSRIRAYQGTAAQWADSGRWVSVKSSNVSKIMYDRPRKRLYVMFRGGDTYYYSVPKVTGMAMFNTFSMGKFVWAMRRRGIVGIKVTED